MFQYVSKKLVFVNSLCQDHGQTKANTDDSAKTVTNRGVKLRARFPLAPCALSPLAPRQKGQAFKQGHIRLGFQQRAMQGG